MSPGSGPWPSSSSTRRGRTLAAVHPVNGTYPNWRPSEPSGATGIVVLDVRRPDEWQEGHITDAVNIPFYDLRSGQDEVPDGEVWVHCKSGYRASIGASLMDCAGHHVVHIDDDWDNVEPAGNPITKP